MITHSLIQSSDAWHQFRLEHFGASEAAAMLGLSSKVKRTELLHMKHSGTAKEFSNWVQENILDYGHEVEAMARPIIEDLISDDLYPVTCSDGQLSASCDGLTMSEEIAFEHKQWNETYAAMVAAGVMPDEHMPQCQQVLLVTGAKKIIFAISDGTREKMAYMEVYPDTEWFKRITAGWEQFAKDLADYVPAEVVIAPVAAAVTALPAVSVRVSGTISVHDNFSAFESALRDFIDHRLILKPETDQDFADLDLQIKALKNAETALDAAEAQMLSQVDMVDLAKRTKDMLHKLARDNRLMAEKMLTTRKEQIKSEISAEGIAALRDHIASLNTRLGKPYMPPISADFGGAIKGKRTVSSLRDAVSTTLANAKIEANTIADKVQINLTTLRELAGDHKFLFADADQIVLKAHDDLTSLVKLRIAEHKDAEEKRVAAERARIQEEERVKAEAKVREAQEDEDALIASLQKNANRIEFDSTTYIQKAIGYFESGAKDWESDPRPRVVEAVAAARQQMQQRLATAQARELAEQTALDAAAAAQEQARLQPAANQHLADITRHEEAERARLQQAPNLAPAWPFPTNAVSRPTRSVFDNRPPITTGALCALAGKGISITAAFIQTLGIHPAERPKDAKSGTYWAAEDVSVIFCALARHFEQLSGTDSAIAA